MNSRYSYYQYDNRIDRLVYRNTIQNRRVRKLVPDSAINQINVQTVLHQFQHVVRDSPINKAIASEVL